MYMKPEHETVHAESTWAAREAGSPWRRGLLVFGVGPIDSSMSRGRRDSVHAPASVPPRACTPGRLTARAQSRETPRHHLPAVDNPRTVGDQLTPAAARAIGQAYATLAWGVSTGAPRGGRTRQSALGSPISPPRAGRHRGRRRSPPWMSASSRLPRSPSRRTPRLEAASRSPDRTIRRSSTASRWSSCTTRCSGDIQRLYLDRRTTRFSPRPGASRPRTVPAHAYRECDVQRNAPLARPLKSRGLRQRGHEPDRDRYAAPTRGRGRPAVDVSTERSEPPSDPTVLENLHDSRSPCGSTARSWGSR